MKPAPRLWLALFFLLLPAASAQDFGPWSVHPRHPSLAKADPQSESSVPVLSAQAFDQWLKLWTTLLTRIDGPRCQHAPSCSAYARGAVARHGLIRGLWMSLNRILRGARSSALRLLPRVRTHRGVRLVDPVKD